MDVQKLDSLLDKILSEKLITPCVLEENKIKDKLYRKIRKTNKSIRKLKKLTFMDIL